MATYPDDATGNFTTDIFTNMANRRPDRNFSISREYDITTFESQAGYEKRRINSRRGKRTLDLTYSNIDGLVRQAIENFYIARSGSYESFTFDLSHVSQIGTMTARFEGPLQITEVMSGAANVLNDVYTVSFTLMETYD